MAEKKLEQILFLKDTAPPLPSPCRVKVASENGDEELELIPPFFFVKTEDDDSLTGMSLLFEEVETPETIEFSKLNPVKLDNMNDGKTESSKDLISHLKLNCKNYLYLHLDFTRSKFGRGKLFVGPLLIDDYERKFVYVLSLKDGYRCNWFFVDSIASVLVKNGDTADIGNLFVKMLQWDIMYFKNNGVSGHQLASEKSSYPCFNFTGGVLDRGKDIELMGRYFYFDAAYDFYVGTITFYELVLKDGHQLDLLLENSIGILLTNEGEDGDQDNGRKMFVKAPQGVNITIGTSTLLCVRLVAIKKSHQVLGTWGEESNRFQQQCELFDTAVLQLNSVIIRWIQLESLKACNEFTPVAEVMELHFVGLFHQVLLIGGHYDMLMLVDFLRWKFRLFSTGLWSLNGGKGDTLFPTDARVFYVETLMDIVSRQGGDELQIVSNRQRR